MKELTLSITDQLVQVFQNTIAPLLLPHDTIKLNRTEDAILVCIVSSDVERLNEISSSAVAAGITILPPSGVIPDDLTQFNDPLLSKVAGIVNSREVLIESVALGVIRDFSFLAPVPRVPPPPPPPEETLSCESARIVADGFGEADTRNVGIGTGTFEEEFAKGLQEARIKALKQATEAQLTTLFKCEPPCQLQFDLLFGEPKERVTSGTSVGGVEVESRLFVSIPWELQVVCRRTPLPTGEVTDAVPPAPDAPISCEGYEVGGTASGSDSEGATTATDQAVIQRVQENARAEAIEEVQKQISDALQRLPHCPRVSCPKESLKIIFDSQLIGPTAGKNENFSGLFYAWRIAAEVKLNWRIILKCSE